MVEADFEEVRHRVVRVPADEPAHSLVDRLAVCRYFGRFRAGEQATRWPWVPGAEGLVIRVEEVRVVRVVDLVAGKRRLQEEGLEEPARMRPVPLGRAHVRHRLD